MKVTASIGSKMGEVIEKSGLLLDSIRLLVVCPNCNHVWGIKVTSPSDLDNMNKFTCLVCLNRGGEK